MAVHSARMGGAQAMALREARSLASEFDVAVAIPAGPLGGEVPQSSQIVRASPTLPLWGASRRRWLLQYARTGIDALRVALFLRRRRVDLVITSSSVLLAPVLGARLARVPVIVHAREEPMTPPGKPVFRMLESLADTVICVSSAVERHFHGGRRARVVVIPDGIRIPPVDSHKKRNGFGDPLRLCLVGSVSGQRGKGQDIAVDALGRLAALGIPASLELVGPIDSPDFAAELRRQAEALGVGEQLDVAGWVEDAGHEMAVADIVLCCSRAEALPLTVMEALVRETPVVATDVGGVRELVEDGETGFLVQSENPEAVAAAVARLVEDPAAAGEMGRRGRELVAGRYSVEVALAAIAEELHRTLAGTRI